MQEVGQTVYRVLEIQQAVVNGVRCGLAVVQELRQHTLGSAWVYVGRFSVPANVGKKRAMQFLIKGGAL